MARTSIRLRLATANPPDDDDDIQEYGSRRRDQDRRRHNARLLGQQVVERVGRKLQVHNEVSEEPSAFVRMPRRPGSTARASAWKAPNAGRSSARRARWRGHARGLSCRLQRTWGYEMTDAGPGFFTKCVSTYRSPCRRSKPRRARSTAICGRPSLPRLLRERTHNRRTGARRWRLATSGVDSLPSRSIPTCPATRSRWSHAGASSNRGRAVRNDSSRGRFSRGSCAELSVLSVSFLAATRRSSDRGRARRAPGEHRGVLRKERSDRETLGQAAAHA